MAGDRFKFPSFVFAVYDHVEHNLAIYRGMRRHVGSDPVMYNVPIADGDVLEMTIHNEPHFQHPLPFHNERLVHNERLAHTPTVGTKWNWWRTPIRLNIKMDGYNTFTADVLVITADNRLPFRKGRHPFFRAATFTIKDTGLPALHAAYMERYKAVTQPAPTVIVKTVIPKHVLTIVLEKAVADKETCAITCEPITIENAAVTTCGHVFTETGLVQSLQRSPLCPICRTKCTQIAKE
jgi:hypothetical protein